MKKWLQGLDKKTRILLIISLIIQIYTAFQAVGSFHPDQHFQILEFATQLLGLPSDAPNVWEYEAKMRPTLAVYIVAGVHEILEFLGINNHFTLLTFLRLVTAFLFFGVMTILTLQTFKTQKTKHNDVLFYTLFFLHLTWFIPYIRGLVGSEAWSGISFFNALIYYNSRKEHLSSKDFFFMGLIMCVSFYMRFQMAFSILALVVWIFVYEKKSLYSICFFTIGFLVAAVVNTMLDSIFYGAFVLTPYEYFYQNITLDRASSFGVSPPYYYIIEIILATGAPVLSVFLFFYLCKHLWSNKTQILVWIFLAFLVGHSMIGHKEERFFFPMLALIPLLVGMGFSDETIKASFLWRNKVTKFLIFPLAFFLNTFLLAVFICIPYSQLCVFQEKTIDYFSHQKEKTKLYFTGRNPFKNHSQSLVHHFYLQQLHPNVTLKYIKNIDSLPHQESQKNYFCIDLSELEEYPQAKFILSKSKTILTNTDILHKFSQFISRKGFPYIIDSWVLVELPPK